MAYTVLSEADPQESVQPDPEEQQPSYRGGGRPPLEPTLHARIIYLMERGQREKAAGIVCEKMQMTLAESEEFVDRLWQRHQEIDWSGGRHSMGPVWQYALWVLGAGVVAGLAWLVWFRLSH